MNRAAFRYLALLFVVLLATAALAEIPRSCTIEGVGRVKQLHNYCGPATMASVLCYSGKQATQEVIGKVVYDPVGGATHGADMLIYAREQGLSAYSLNTSIKDVKRFIAAGVPVIALQQNSMTDTSGHYRILVGFDDDKQMFRVVDPYYETVEISYADMGRLWSRWGHWALVIVPKDKDVYKEELETSNVVCHMDLCYAEFKRKNYEKALNEANIALNLNPGNRYTLNLVEKIKTAQGAGRK